MFDHPVMKWPRTDLITIGELIKKAIQNKEGFSVIRLGDGEGALLNYKDAEMEENLKHCLKIWFGSQILSNDELANICTQLENAIASADILGLPRKKQLHIEYRYCAILPKVLQIFGSHPPVITDAAVHLYLQWSGALGQILYGKDLVSVIGCRDVGSRLQDTLKIGEVRSYFVRGEDAFPGKVVEKHWPHGFNDILHCLEKIDPGEIFLVGAGVLGKIYCDKIKSRNGIAIDIGSLLDAWDGVPSRKNIGLKESSLQHLAEPPQSFDEARNLLQRVMAKTHIPDGTF